MNTCRAEWADHNKLAVYVCEESQGHKGPHGAVCPIDGSWVELERATWEILGWKPLYLTSMGYRFLTPTGERVGPPTVDDLVEYLNSSFPDDWVMGNDSAGFFGGLSWYTSSNVFDGSWSVWIECEPSLSKFLETLVRRGQGYL